MLVGGNTLGGLDLQGGKIFVECAELWGLAPMRAHGIGQYAMSCMGLEAPYPEEEGGCKTKPR